MRRVLFAALAAFALASACRKRRRSADRTGPRVRRALRAGGQRQGGARRDRRRRRPSSSENADIGVATVRSAATAFAGDVAPARARRRDHQPRHRPAPRDAVSAPRIEKDPAHARLGRRRPRRQAPTARRAAVGHADDPRHAAGLLRAPAGLARGPRRRHGHRHRRAPPRHRAELQRAPEPELHRRRPDDRGACDTVRTGRARPANSTRTATGRTSPSTIALAVNGIGIAGVAPNATSSTCAPARTRATSSSARRSTRSLSPATTASTWSTCASTSTRGSTTAPPTRRTRPAEQPSSGS